MTAGMHDAISGFAAALSGRYSIQREMGRGGNAIVYLAQDHRHDRLVALKVLLPELAVSVRKERFLREIQIAAKLTHPHILPLHDSGETDDTVYYVMPYVDGESLRDRLVREPRLPLADALRIAWEVASALAYAHSHGVVHRDIKPENILLQDGMVLVADFGIARALSEAGAERLTHSAIAVGTPEYMSPEQGEGSTVADGRSDLYALGCVLYEMLAGHPPFTGSSPHEILARHAFDPVPRLAAARPDLPEAVEGAVRKALAKAPEDRFATSAEFAATLSALAGRASTEVGTLAAAGQNASWRSRASRTRVGVMLVGLAVLLIGGLAVLRESSPAQPAALRSLAVLPFVNTTRAPADEYLADGLTEDLISALTSIDSLRVTARTTAFSYKGRNLDARTVGRQLRADALLEGSVRADTSRLKVVAQLVRVADGSPIWSRTYERPRRDILAVQEDIARSIADAIELQLLPDVRSRVLRRHTRNVEAYDLYLRGRFLWDRRTREASAQAIDYFRRAIANDSTYALAYSGLADTYIIAGQVDYLPAQEAFRSGKEAALRAVALDPTLAETHTSLARVLTEADWDLRGSEREYRRAIELNPRYALARSWYGLLLGWIGRSEAAIKETRLAVDADPLAPAYRLNYGNTLLWAGRYDEAIEQYRESIRLEPGILAGWLTHAYLVKGDFASARAEAERRAQLGNQQRGVIAHAAAKSGRRDEAVAILEELQSIANRRSGRVDYQIALAHLGLNNHEQALRALAKAVAERQVRPPSLASPVLNPIRADPRFRQFERTMGMVF